MQVVKDDIDAQRKGAAYVFWSHNIRINDFRTRRLIHQRILQAIPVRLNAAHCCLPCEIHAGSNMGNSGSNGGSGSGSSSNRQVVISMIQSFFTYALGPTLRSRLRIHTGMLRFRESNPLPCRLSFALSAVVSYTNTYTHLKFQILNSDFSSPSLSSFQVPQRNVYIYYKHLASNPIRCQSIQILVKSN